MRPVLRVGPGVEGKLLILDLFREILLLIPPNTGSAAPNCGARDVEIDVRGGVVLRIVRPDDPREELPLDRDAEPEDEREPELCEGLELLDELRLLPELRLSLELLDDEGGEALRLCLANDAEATINRTASDADSVNVIFAFVTRMIASPVNSDSGSKLFTAGICLYNLNISGTICQAAATSRRAVLGLCGIRISTLYLRQKHRPPPSSDIRR